MIGDRTTHENPGRPASLLRRGVLAAGAIGAVGAWSAAAAPTAEAAVTISQGELDRIAVVASAARFSGIDATGATDSSAGLQKAMNAVPEGGLLVIPTGTYLVGTSLYPRLAKSLRVSAHGATLIATSSKPIFSVSGAYGTVLPVTAVTIAAPAGASAVSQLSVGGTPDWAPGTIVKIVSDDPIPERRPGDGVVESRLGEFAVVRSSSGSTVVLGGVLRETYSTNIRVAQISDQTFSIEGGTLMVAAARATASNEPLVYFSRLRYPQLRSVTVTRASGPVFRFTSCYGYLVEDAVVRFATDDAGSSILGYGVSDVGSSFGQVDRGVYSHVRHSYSDDTNRVAANSDLSGYGRTYGTVVSGVNALMTTSSAFDTHHCSEGVTFIGCTATSGIGQGSQGQSGYQLRGIGHRVVDCTARFVENGVIVQDEAKGGDSRSHQINGFRAFDARGAAVRVVRRPAGHPSAGVFDPSPTVTASDVYAERTGALLVSFNASVVLAGGVFRAGASNPGTGDYHGIYSENSLLRIRDTILDFEANTSGTPRPIGSGSTAGAVPGQQRTEIDGLEVRSTPDVVARTWGVFSGTDHLVRARNVRFSYPFRYMPGENLSPQSSVEWRCDVPADGATEVATSGVFVWGNNEVTATQKRLPLSPDPVIMVRLVSTNTLTMAALPSGSVFGQRLHLLHAGARPVTVRHGAAGGTALTGGQDVAVDPGGQLLLFWDGGAWRQSV
ncbi:hypothetical protein [Rathayibacter sp. AY1B5]|uniref:hypothetical protein n=1 Tax=Rathayibacter sp. AY1B5 TaxID=2080530 RepID=UPI000CE7F309|nr:hypothetical protein [Rathayibacter sp. AY1B5]PPI27481.1 hypothetical protein C5D44_03560 [Rathayibacter sp. AY1B5]